MKLEVNEINHKIIGCAMQVHSVLGNGFQEVIYQKPLACSSILVGTAWNSKGCTTKNWTSSPPTILSIQKILKIVF